MTTPHSPIDEILNQPVMTPASPPIMKSRTCILIFEQIPRDWHTRSVTLSATKGLSERFFAPLRMTLPNGHILKCTKVMWFDLVLWHLLLLPLVFAWACGGANFPARPQVIEPDSARSADPLPSLGAVEAPSQSFTEQIEQNFLPYRQGPPRVPDIEIGTAITQENWQLAQGILSQQLLEAVRTGEITILVQATSDLPSTPEYMAATRESASAVTLNTNGDVMQYQAGRPFPVLDPTDSRAGLKAAWNARYADCGDSVQRLESLEVRNTAGAYQYGFSFSYARAYGMHRARPERNIPAWESEGILYKEFMQVHHPAPAITVHPLLGLVHLWYWHDHEKRPVAQWYVMGFLSINRLRTLVYNPEASAWRFPILHEDLFGTYVRAYQWRLLDTRVALVPGFVQGAQPLFGGKRGGYPLDPWELRTVHVVEAVPRSAAHPYGRRVFYFDQQTFAPLYVLIFDRQGKHWRTGFFVYANPGTYPGAKDVRVPILVGRSWIDFLHDRVTLARVTDAVYDQPLAPEYFTLANMIRKGK